VLQARALDPETFRGGRSDTLPRADVPSSSGASNGSGALNGGVVLTSLSLDHAEDVLIAKALEVTGRNRTRAAALLGISVRTLRYKLNGPPASSTMSEAADD